MSDIEHGVTCAKVAHVHPWFLQHLVGTHADEDDGPFVVNGSLRCGRCHAWLRRATPEDTPPDPVPEPPPLDLDDGSLVRLSLCPELSDGSSRSIVSDAAAVAAAVEVFLADARLHPRSVVGTVLTIEVVRMSDADFEALPDL